MIVGVIHTDMMGSVSAASGAPPPRCVSSRAPSHLNNLRASVRCDAGHSAFVKVS
jgi:hypothetical protein